MAEAFGVAADILTFLSLATAVIKSTTSLADEMKSADAYISSLIQELQDYEKMLSDLDKLKNMISKSSDDTIREADLSLELSRQSLAELKNLRQLLKKTRGQLAGGRRRRLWHKMD